MRSSLLRGKELMDVLRSVESKIGAEAARYNDYTDPDIPGRLRTYISLQPPPVGQSIKLPWGNPSSD